MGDVVRGEAVFSQAITGLELRPGLFPSGAKLVPTMVSTRGTVVMPRQPLPWKEKEGRAQCWTGDGRWGRAPRYRNR